MWVRRFALNRAGIWQDNCFMGIQCVSISHDLDSFGSVLIAAAAVFTSQLSCQMVIRFDLPAKRV